MRRSGRRSRSIAGHELQVVVVHPDDGAGRRGAGRRLGEALVDRDVGLPPLLLEARGADGVVVERPEGVVGEAVVEAGDVVVREGHGDERDAVVLERAGVVVGEAGPADPRARRWWRMTPSMARTSPPGLGSQRRVAGVAVHRQPVGDDDEVVPAGTRALVGRSLAAGNRRAAPSGRCRLFDRGTDGPGPRPGAATRAGSVTRRRATRPVPGCGAAQHADEGAEARTVEARRRHGGRRQGPSVRQPAAQGPDHRRLARWSARRRGGRRSALVGHRRS